MSRLLSIKEIEKLERKKFRDEWGVFVAEGQKVIEEVVATQWPITQLLITAKFQHDHRDFLTKLDISKQQVVVISDATAERISDTVSPAGIFAIVQKPVLQLGEVLKKHRVAIFEEIRDPGNLGTMIRTADWFGAEAIIISRDSADPYSGKVLRGAMGSVFHLPIYSSPNLVTDLMTMKADQFHILVARPEVSAHSLRQLTTKWALVMGNESRGTSAQIDELADEAIVIPLKGNAESLNVAVSFGILMYQLTQLPQS
jgi:TrmH family RNA methyltransferase